MPINEEQVRQLLGQVPYPGFSRDIVSAGVLRGMQVSGGEVLLDLALDGAEPRTVERIQDAVRQVLARVDGVRAVGFKPPAAAPSASLNVVNNPGAPQKRAEVPRSGEIPGVKEIVAVASGKGGVGKSTVAVNLAVALARRGSRVGLLDADIYGPSIPLMMGALDQRPTIDAEKQRLLPVERFGVRFISLGFMVDPEEAVIWRGPMVMKALEQLLRDVHWGDLDVLVVDLPPGTGDAQLTLSQQVRLSGAVIVTTPQDVALADAIKGVNMFRKVGVPVMGLVENMSYFQCPHCAERTDIFGHGGGRAQAKRLEVPFLGEIPLEPRIRTSGDLGEPVATAAEEEPAAAAFLGLADAVNKTLAAEAARE
jgi:ATP-binding protein involved in chromosome partitioning